MKTTFLIQRIFVLFALLAIIGAGCSISRPYPEKQTFVLETHRPPSAPVATNAVLLRISPFTVVAPFDRQSFVYRLSDLNYEPDFYHQFIVSPAPLISGETRVWLDDAGVVRAVLNPGNKVIATHILEGNVTELFADLRDAKSAQAVLAIQFTVTDEQSPTARIVFHKSYRQALSLTQRTPEAMARAWSDDLTAILQQLETDLRGVDWDGQRK